MFNSLLHTPDIFAGHVVVVVVVVVVAAAVAFLYSGHCAYLHLDSWQACHFN